MAMMNLLPQSTYRPPSPVQVHERGTGLDPIMEVDDEGSSRGSYVAPQRKTCRDRYVGAPPLPPPLKSFLSSSSSSSSTQQGEQFPTPRGTHHLTAPVIASSPSDSESSSSVQLSEPWSQKSHSTAGTDFDDLYDVSSEDEDRDGDDHVKRLQRVKRISVASSTASRKSLPPLTIPATPAEDHWAEVQAFKALTSPIRLKISSPIVATPCLEVPPSPAVLSMLQRQQQHGQVPSASTPPSLDGSLGSDQLAQMSAPPTPDVGYESDEVDEGWGVQLEPAALATLQALAGETLLDEEASEDQVIEIDAEPPDPPAREMQQLNSRLPALNTNLRHPTSVVLSPTQMQSLNMLSRLDIPSPGGFFASLNGMARHSWHLAPMTPKSPRGLQPPSSTTAENFYNTPWTSQPKDDEPPDKCIISSPKDITSWLHQMRDTTYMRPELQRKDSSEETVKAKIEPLAGPCDDLEPDELVICDAVVAPRLDRTYIWLAAQHDYISELINPKESRDDEQALLRRAVSVKQKPALTKDPSLTSASSTSPPRKTVRFSGVSVEACPLPKIVQESTYFLAFRLFIRKSRSTDAFSHRIPRFEAAQATRVSFPDLHRMQLLGKYQLSVRPSSPQRRMSANVARGDEEPEINPRNVKRDKTREATEQITAAMWNVMAIRFLNGNRLLDPPMTRRLSRLSFMAPRHGLPRDRLRILDLGGQPTCDWAWQCALEYPNCKVYTVTTKALRQMSNSNIRGPYNHRQVAVERLTRVPFGDEHFDVVSAREIHSILREHGEHGLDEWDACLAECMRILKPGGYLDFSIMDSEVVNAGALGNAKSVEFGFNLKTLGYDAAPTKRWLGRLERAGFVGIKRAWVFLPMGERRKTSTTSDDVPSEEEPSPNGRAAAGTQGRDGIGDVVPLSQRQSPSPPPQQHPSPPQATPAIKTMPQAKTGSTDATASIAGLVGAWAWERWMLRCQVQSVGEEAARLEGVQDVLEEGRRIGSGWRVVQGWARKPWGGGGGDHRGGGGKGRSGGDTGGDGRGNGGIGGGGRGSHGGSRARSRARGIGDGGDKDHGPRTAVV